MATTHHVTFRRNSMAATRHWLRTVKIKLRGRWWDSGVSDPWFIVFGIFHSYSAAHWPYYIIGHPYDSSDVFLHSQHSKPKFQPFPTSPTLFATCDVTCDVTRLPYMEIRLHYDTCRTIPIPHKLIPLYFVLSTSESTVFDILRLLLALPIINSLCDVLDIHSLHPSDLLINHLLAVPLIFALLRFRRGSQLLEMSDLVDFPSNTVRDTLIRFGIHPPYLPRMSGHLRP